MYLVHKRFVSFAYIFVVYYRMSILKRFFPSNLFINYVLFINSVGDKTLKNLYERNISAVGNDIKSVLEKEMGSRGFQSKINVSDKDNS